MKRMNNMILKFVTDFIDFLSHKWNGLIGLFGTAGGTIAVKETNDYMKAITESGDYVKLYHTNEIQYYSDNDSLRAVIDSLQNLNSIGRAVETHQGIVFIDYMRNALLIITLIIGICTIVGNANKFIIWVKNRKIKKRKLTDWDDE
jgi:hypothetical protein